MLPLAATTVDLSPNRPVAMGGHDGAPRLTRHVHDPLEANIVALGDGEDTVVIVSVDTLFIGAGLRDHILAACAARFRIGPERVLVLASHTHSAPMLDPGKPAIGIADADEIARCARRIADAIAALEPATAATLRHGRGVCDLAVNRRLRWRIPTLLRLMGRVGGDIYLCDNPAGPRDPRVRTAVWQSVDGRPLAMLWSFACHPTAFPVAETASADYVGVVRRLARDRFGPALPVVFAPGCMGDVRPPSAPRTRRLTDLPRLLAFGPQSVSMNHAQWQRWAADVADTVVGIATDGTEVAPAGSPDARPMIREPLATIFDGTSPTPVLHLKAVRLPGFGRIVSISCEPVTAIGTVLPVDPDDLVVGYEGEVFGYLPTDAMIGEGGYEAHRFMRYFGLVGRFRSNLDSRIASLGQALLSGQR